MRGINTLKPAEAIRVSGISSKNLHTYDGSIDDKWLDWAKTGSEGINNAEAREFYKNTGGHHGR